MTTVPQATPETTDAWRRAVHAVAQRAHEALPLANGRIDRAVEIILTGGVELFEDGHAVVASQSRPHTQYAVNGICPCADAESAPHGGLCKHRLAVAILKRARQEMAPIATPVERRCPTCFIMQVFSGGAHW